MSRKGITFFRSQAEWIYDISIYSFPSFLLFHHTYLVDCISCQVYLICHLSVRSKIVHAACKQDGSQQPHQVAFPPPSLTNPIHALHSLLLLLFTLKSVCVTGFVGVFLSPHLAFCLPVFIPPDPPLSQASP